jgi:CPA1 family monovalent cation:H+ antiporter
MMARSRFPHRPWQEPALVSWVGIRGGISLAAALAIPSALPDGSPFRGRDEILLLTFAVILATLVIQGLSLPGLLRRLNFSDGGAERAEEHRARDAIARAALHFLESVTDGDEIQRRAVRQLQDAYRNRAEGLAIAHEARLENPEAEYMSRLIALERNLVVAERSSLIDLRDGGAISDDVMRRFEVMLDLKESELEEEETRWRV